MDPFPHQYKASASASASSNVTMESPGLESLETTAPPEFGGPAGYWSPETLLVAAVADCFILSFKAVSAASKLEWLELTVEVEGTLDRVDGVNRFTFFRVKPHLNITREEDRERALKVLEKSDKICLVSNSLKADFELETQVTVAGA